MGKHKGNGTLISRHVCDALGQADWGRKMFVVYVHSLQYSHVHSYAHHVASAARHRASHKNLHVVLLRGCRALFFMRDA